MFGYKAVINRCNSQPDFQASQTSENQAEAMQLQIVCKTHLSGRIRLVFPEYQVFKAHACTGGLSCDRFPANSLA